MSGKFELAEGFERTMQVNVIGTLLLALLLRPKLQETGQKHGVETHLEVVSSEAHHLTTIPAADEKDLYAALNDSTRPFDPQTSYNISKALEILFVREVITETGSTPIITLVNPGFCKSEFLTSLDVSKIKKTAVRALQAILARTTEVGSRTLVAGITAGIGSHGHYMADGMDQEPASWVTESRGQQVQKTVYKDTLAVLEKIQPGIQGSL